MHCSVVRLFQETRKRLAPVSGDLAQKEAELIFEEALDIPRSTLYTGFNTSVSSAQCEVIQSITSERLTGSPLAHILGYTFFYENKFAVSKDALIPRPDTESLVRDVLHNETSSFCQFIDIGTGTGNIAESLCVSRPRWQALAVDISELSLRLAKRNCCNRIYLLCCDKLSSIKGRGTFDFIVTNPPYVSIDEMNELDACVIDYEPKVALYGGEDGLDFYRYLATHSKGFLKKDGWIYCEIGYLQDKKCKAIFETAGWQRISISHDLASRPRVIKAQK